MRGSIPSWARVGAKVVCVSAPWFTEPEPGYSHPVIGGTYTVSGTQFSIVRDAWGISCAEGSINDVYAVRNFRPAVEPKSEAEDLALFRNIAGATPEPDRQTYVRELLTEWESEAGH